MSVRITSLLLHTALCLLPLLLPHCSFASYFFFVFVCFLSCTLLVPLVFSLPIQNTKKKKIRTQNDTLMVIEKKRGKENGYARHNVHPLVLTAVEIRLLLWIFGSFYLCKCVWILFLICASIDSEPSDLKKSHILSSSNDVTLKLISLTVLF